MKKVVQKTCMAIVAALVFVLCICVKPDTAQAADGGWLYFNADDGNWYYYVDGVYDFTFSSSRLITATTFEPSIILKAGPLFSPVSPR